MSKRGDETSGKQPEIAQGSGFCLSPDQGPTQQNGAPPGPGPISHLGDLCTLEAAPFSSRITSGAHTEYEGLIRKNT